MLHIKRDVNQLDFTIVDIYFRKSELFSLTWSCGSRQRDTTWSEWKVQLNNFALKSLIVLMIERVMLFVIVSGAVVIMFTIINVLFLSECKTTRCSAFYETRDTIHYFEYRFNTGHTSLTLKALKYSYTNHRDQRVFYQIKIIINVLVSSFRFILIYVLGYGHYIYFTLSVRGSILGVRIWHLKSIPAL